MTNSHLSDSTAKRLCRVCLFTFAFLALELLVYLAFVFDLCFDSCTRERWQIWVGYSLQLMILAGFTALMIRRRCFGFCCDADRRQISSEDSANSELSGPLVSDAEAS